MWWTWTGYWFDDDGHHYEEIQAAIGFMFSFLFVGLMGYLWGLGFVVFYCVEKMKAEKKRARRERTLPSFKDIRGI
jgi:hypothetical protein